MGPASKTTDLARNANCKNTVTRPPLNSFVRLCVLGAALGLCLIDSVFGQSPPSAPTDLASPEILVGGRVIFRLYAPAAQAVTVLGQWDDQAHALNKDARGIWSVTLGPIPPGYWIYNFVMDGVALADPVNPLVKLRMRTSASLLDLPGNPPSPWDVRAGAPHGAIEINWHESKVCGDTRAFYVYTPPGYDPTQAKRYPVLYLNHGNNGLPSDWTAAGRANFIADNLLADGRMVPTIIVMASGHTLPITVGPQPDNGPRLERYLIEEVVPAVEKKYRVVADREHRAVMGLSMGGSHSLNSGLRHPETFAWVGAFSAGGIRDFEIRFKPLLADPAGANAKYKLIWIGCGKQDANFAASEGVDRSLTAAGIKHTFFTMDGVHNYVVWRRCLLETLPLLFRE
jgi:enterochelin esterase-like enzyme